jgi:hypothetical protein
MAQLCHRSRFAQETIGNVFITRDLTADDLDCDTSFETEMGRKVNSAHAAGSDFAFNLEPASDNLRDNHIDLPSG